jgi:mono/diheme cytochrome c family protein
MVKGAPPAVLAVTSVSDGRVLPYSHVNCNALRTFLAPLLVSLALPSREAIFGRALGRVVAHELYHILTKERLHGQDGIGAAQFTAEQLMSADLRFGEREVERLRASLVPIVLSYESLSGSGLGSGTSIYVTSGCSGCHGWRGEGTQWGPPLRKESKAYDAAALAAFLRNTSSKMYRRAKDLNVLWPRLENAQIEELSAYLRSRHN